LYYTTKILKRTLKGELLYCNMQLKQDDNCINDDSIWDI